MASPQGIDGGAHQNIARVSATLSALARSGNTGLRLSDVARQTEISKAAAHRNLTGLVAHGLAVFDADTNRFYLGDRILTWIDQAADRFEPAHRIEPHLRRLADELQDTVYFSVRRGDDAVCYGRAVGSFPVQSLTLQVGDHRPLGVGSGSLAILAFLDRAEIDRVLRERVADRASYPLTDDQLRSKIDEAVAAGYTTMDHALVQGIHGLVGVGVPIRDRHGRSVAALSLAALRDRTEPPRLAKVVTRLHAEAAVVEQELADLLARR